MGVTPPTDRAAAAFERIAREYERDPRVSRGTMLVSEGLRVDGHFFAALAHGQLLVKLPRERVQELIGDGVAVPFRSGKGARIMKEWALVPPSATRRWKALVKEALTFVG